MESQSADEKAALLLLSLGPEVAENVLARFGPDQQEMLRARMMRQRQLSPGPEVFDDALRDFDQLMREVEFDRLTPLETNRPVEVSRQPERPVVQETPMPSEGDMARDPFAVMAQLDAEQLARALLGESARAISMILSCLSTDRAVAVLKLLPPKLRCEVMVQMGLRATDDLEIVPRIARAILEKVRAAGNIPAVAKSDEARYTKTADMLRNLEEPDRTAIMNTIAQQNKNIAAMIREYLYYFDDIIFIEDRSLQRILSGLDVKHLAMSLKGASQMIIEKVMQNVSTRVQEMLTEEMELLGAVPNAQVEKARAEIVEVIQRLDQAGELLTTRKRGQ